MTKAVCLGIESTAHTFGASIARKDLSSSNSFEILSDERDVYRPPEGSGIHPREASRHHLETCSAVVEAALAKASFRMTDVDFISYSAGPGLGPCLRVGGTIARGLASYFQKPLVAANHAIGHIELGKYLTGTSDPLVLIISGGHTALAVAGSGRWRILGETLDLTLGQLLDQLGRFMGLASPAGRIIESLAQNADDQGRVLLRKLPYVIKGNDVSYSGLLSAAKELISKGERKESVSFAVQEVAFSILAEATERALAFTGKEELLVTGGVAANRRLSTMLSEMCENRGCRAGIIEGRYAGDCGAQIAAEGFRLFKEKKFVEPDEAFVRQSWRIDQIPL